MKSPPTLQSRELLVKSATAVGAFFLVLAFALAALMSPYQTLAEFLLMLRPHWLEWINQPAPPGFFGWLWNNVVVPILVRPDWLVPMMIGLVFVGIAAQITWGKASAGRK